MSQKTISVGTSANPVSLDTNFINIQANFTELYGFSAPAAGGRTITGGTQSGDDLTIDSTSDATKGSVVIQPDGGSVLVGGSTKHVGEMFGVNGRLYADENAYIKGSLFCGYGSDASDISTKVGYGRTIDGNSFYDLFSDASNNTTYSSRLIRYSGTNGGLFLYQNGTGAINFSTPDGAAIAFRPGDTEKARFSGDALLIGATTPVGAEKLRVNGNVYTDGAITSKGVIYVGYNAPGTAAIVKAGYGRTADGASYYELFCDSSNNTAYSARLLRYSGANGGLELVQRGTGPLKLYAIDGANILFQTGTTEAMRIVGNSLIIGTTATVGTEKLRVNGDAYVDNNVSALSFTDRTPHYEGDALAEISKIAGKDGEIDHDTLPSFARKDVKKVHIEEGERIPVADEDAWEEYEEIEEVEVTEDVLEEKTAEELYDEVMSAEAFTLEASESIETHKVVSKPKIERIDKKYTAKDGQVVLEDVPVIAKEEIRTVTKKLKDGVNVDPDTGELYRVEEIRTETSEPGRDIGAMVSMLTVAIQQLTERVRDLEGKLTVASKVEKG